MATIKSHTDIPQGLKLEEVLPLESADMHYVRVYFEGNQSDWFVKLGRPVKSDNIIPCWSLSALLSVLPEIQGSKPIIDLNDNYITYPHISNLHTKADNPVDACVKMLLKLNKLKRM